MFVSGRIFVLTPQLVLTYNFATTITETTTHKLWTLATELFLVFSFQNCELKQELRTLATELNPSLYFSDQRKDVIKHSRWIGLELFRNRNFATNFCFNSKQTACFDLQFCHCHLWSHIPQIVDTYNRASTGHLVSKLWVKTRIPHTGNRASPTPQISQSWKKVFFQTSRAGVELFRNRNFAVNFCFNSKQTACFDLQFCHRQICNRNPQIVNTGNRAFFGLLISKLWVKTRILHTCNRAKPTP